MVSIVIPVFNNLFFTQMVVGLIQQTTKIDYEIIIVDNASTEPGMQEYLKWIKNHAGLNLFGSIKIINNDENLGVAKAWNQGIKMASGDYIAVINNDIIFGNETFDKMSAALDINPDVWCLCPVFTRKDMSENWHKTQFEQSQKKQNIVRGQIGFFYMFRREAIKQLKKPKEGYFVDEQFDMLWYEDTDLFKRFEEAGHPVMTLTNILIHHFESKTIALVPEAGKHKADNRQKFNEKYGIEKL